MMDFNKFLISPVLIISLTLMNCAGTGNLYKGAELKEKKEQVYTNLRRKNVKVHKKNDDVVVGFLQDVRNDSLIISLNEKKDAKQIILAEEVKYIKIVNEDNLLLGSVIFAVFVSALVILIISVSNFGQGISKAK